MSTDEPQAGGTPPHDDRQRDPWHDDPDAWERADQQWREKWEGREAEDDPIEPPPADYQPTKASARTVASSYGSGMREGGQHLTIGLQIAMSMLFFVGAGWAVDEWLGTSPWGILIGTVLGFVGVIAFVVRLAQEANKPRR